MSTDLNKTPPKKTRAPRDRQPLEVALVPDALLSLRVAATVAGLSIPTIYRTEKRDASFPRLVRIGARCTRVRAGELLAWLAAQRG